MTTLETYLTAALDRRDYDGAKRIARALVVRAMPVPPTLADVVQAVEARRGVRLA